jgi:hypothetical protein
MGRGQIRDRHRPGAKLIQHRPARGIGEGLEDKIEGGIFVSHMAL